MVETLGTHSAVVAVGEELLSGQTIDTNGSWLSERLASLGAPVLRRWVVGDHSSEIQNAVSAAVDVAELVIVTGGLGPTEDDLTRQAVADCLGLELILDPRLLQGLRDRFRVRGHGDLPPSNLVQAEVPEGAEVLPNARGSAPGLWIDVEGLFVVLLPGVPREMRGMFDEELAPRVRERFGSRLAPLIEKDIPHHWNPGIRARRADRNRPRPDPLGCTNRLPSPTSGVSRYGSRPAPRRREALCVSTRLKAC